MKILVLGGDGMLGHQLFSRLGSKHSVACTLRSELSRYQRYGMYSAQNSFERVDVRDFDRVSAVLRAFEPNVVVNCVGIVKQRESAQEAIPSIEVNALFPHKLALLCEQLGARTVHISTDCVFSGRKGGYTESDVPDPLDLYGKTKALGEIAAGHCLTLRTSIIGRELSRHSSLIDWFLSQSGTVSGYSKAIFSGLTTIQMSRVIETMIERFPEASGLYHVSNEPISKFELLHLVREKFGLQLAIEKDEEFHCDRSLNSDRFRAEFDFSPPDWGELIEEMAGESAERTTTCH